VDVAFLILVMDFMMVNLRGRLKRLDGQNYLMIGFGYCDPVVFRIGLSASSSVSDHFFVIEAANVMIVRATMCID